MKPHWIAVVMAATALAVPPLASLAADTPVARTVSSADRMANARRAIDAKDWTIAQRELASVIKDEPNHADAHNLMGYSWRKRGNPDVTKAFEHYYTALRIDPNHKGAHEYIGQAYLMEKRLPQAEQHLVKLQEICGGTGCNEYQELAKSIAEFKAKQ